MANTPQESFWSGSFGDEYSDRNVGNSLLSHKISMFSKIIHRTNKVGSVIEFGANIGLNIVALKTLLPDARYSAVEINTSAYDKLKEIEGVEAVNGSIFDYEVKTASDLSFTAGVLIHLNPDLLPQAYEKLVKASSRYVMVAEYYSPSPTAIKYRGHEDRLFKRDFAGEILDAHPELQLVDYGFIYRRDPVFPGDDLTWFLMEKR